jgi:cyclohexyl-isocyanide hydratase
MNIGFLLYPRITSLDLVGPHEILSRVGTPIVVGEYITEFISDNQLVMKPNTDFENCPDLDVFVIPGGVGVDEAIKNEKLLNFVRTKGERSEVVVSVCTGALILAASGLTKGKTASTHWLARKELGRLGAKPSPDRVVEDGKYWSSAGVSAGIDLALHLVARLRGEDAAKKIQLQLEYDPRPPFHAGNPDSAPKHIVDSLREMSRYER